MKFNDVKSGLSWYFNSEIYRRPHGFKSLDFLKVRTSHQHTPFEEEIKAFLKIREILDVKLKPKECYILHHEFSRRGKNQDEIAEHFGLSGDRTVRKIRDRAVKKLRIEFLNSGLLASLQYEDPVYDHG